MYLDDEFELDVIYIFESTDWNVCSKYTYRDFECRRSPYHVDRGLELSTCRNGLRCLWYLEANNNRHPHICENVGTCRRRGLIPRSGRGKM